MSTPRHRRPGTPVDPATELDDDQGVENRIFWKGLLALVITAGVAVARQRWWI
jgi:hypothetical protein